MTDPQENKLSSYEAADSCLSLDENQPIWTPIEPFAELVTQFRTCKSQIYEIAIAQNHITTGAAQDKTDARTALEEAIIKVINAVVAYAISIDDSNLEETISYSVTMIRSSRDTVLIDIAGNVYNIAFPLRQHLPTFYVTEADVNLVQTLSDSFRQQIASPRYEKVLNKGFTADLKQKFAEADEILNQKIDKMILIFRPAHPNFVQNYFDAREIINLGHRFTGQKVGRITGTVLQAVTLIPLHNALIEVVGAKRTTKTNDKGFFTLIYRKKSFVTLRISLAEHNTQTSQLITVTLGSTINLNIELTIFE